MKHWLTVEEGQWKHFHEKHHDPILLADEIANGELDPVIGQASEGIVAQLPPAFTEIEPLHTSGERSGP
jgi:hypothetical protein